MSKPLCLADWNHQNRAGEGLSELIFCSCRSGLACSEILPREPSGGAKVTLVLKLCEVIREKREAVTGGGSSFSSKLVRRDYIIRFAKNVGVDLLYDHSRGIQQHKVLLIICIYRYSTYSIELNGRKSNVISNGVQQRK